MRSRLEAKFAAQLDRAGVDNWQYEPMCFADESGQYLPDFHIPMFGEPNIYIEVKPTRQLAHQWLNSQMSVIWSTEPRAHLVAAWFDEDNYEPKWKLARRCASFDITEWVLWSEPDHRPWIFDDRIEICYDGVEVTFDIIDTDEFYRLLPLYYGKGGQELKWAGPTLPPAESWRLVYPRETRTPFWPQSIEVSNNGDVTDTYNGQFFCRSQAGSILERIEWTR